MRQPAGVRVVVPGPESWVVDLDANSAAQALARDAPRSPGRTRFIGSVYDAGLRGQSVPGVVAAYQWRG